MKLRTILALLALAAAVILIGPNGNRLTGWRKSKAAAVVVACGVCLGLTSIIIGRR